MISLNSLLSTTSHLIQQSSTWLVTQKYEQQLIEKKIDETESNQYTFVTESDRTVQNILVSGLKQFSPDLKIRGEEDILNWDNFDPSDLPIHTPIDIFSQFDDIELDISKLCIWIDPIDCTHCFLTDMLDMVSIIVGLSYENKPLAGAIGFPFWKEPSLFLGAIPFAAYKISNFCSPFRHITDLTPLPGSQDPPTFRVVENPKIICPWNSEEQTISLLNHIEYESITCAPGSGYKTAMLLENKADISFCPYNPGHGWDLCGGHALLKTVGGDMESTQGSIQYHDSRSNHDPLLNIKVDGFSPSGVIGYRRNRFKLIPLLSPKLY